MTTTLPLTFSQSTAHRLHSANGTSVAGQYATFRIDGTLDVPVLRAAVNALVRDHDALRLVVERDADGSIGQRLLPAPADALSTQHVKARSVEQFHRYANGTLTRDLTRGWAAESPYPFRLRLLRHDEHLHALLAVFHKAAVDLHGVNSAMVEVWRYYRAVVSGLVPPDPIAGPAIADVAIGQQAVSHRTSRQHWADIVDRIPTDCRFAVHRVGTDDANPSPSFIRLRRDETESALRESGGTVFQVAVAALAQSTAAVMGDRAPVVYVPVNTRGNRVRDAIGMYTLSLPLVLGRTTDGGQAIADVRQQLVQAHLRHHVDFAALWHDIRGTELGHRCVVANFFRHRPWPGSDTGPRTDPRVTYGFYRPSLRFRTGTVDVTMVIHSYADRLRIELRTELTTLATALQQAFRSTFFDLLNLNSSRTIEEWRPA